MKKKSKVMMLFLVILSISVLISINTLSLPINSRREGIIIIDNAYREVTLVEPTPLRGCNGLVFGPDGALYVCQTGVNTISKIELRKAGPHRVETFVGPHHGVYVPDDITVDDEGNFYTTSAITGEVYKINSLGMKEVIGRGFGGPNGICYDDVSGRLFMSECFWGNKVWELDPKGELPPRLLTDALAVPEGFAIRGNKLVIPDLGTGLIVEVDMDTGGITYLVTSGLITPVALTIGPSGFIYIVEMVTGFVKKISPDGSSIE
ncbi:MAG: Vgb family protein, partial [Candidatus Hodarchaeales archaeon]